MIFRDASRSQEELLQVLLPATWNVSFHSLTWLLCRQSQLWVQVWTVVSIYSAFVLLSASTDPVQTNTCGQRNKDVKTKSTTQEVSAITQLKQTRDGVQIPLYCIFFTPESIIRYLGQILPYILFILSYCLQTCSYGWTSVNFRGFIRVQNLMVLF